MQSILTLWQDELPRTKRVLSAFPVGTDEFRPHGRSASALEIATVLVVALRTMSEVILTDTAAFRPVQAPVTSDLKAASAMLDDGLSAFADRVGKVPTKLLSSTILVPAGPENTMPVPRAAMLQMLLHDHIHHRGQLSVYLRLAGGKVPSIYGPSADESPGA